MEENRVLETCSNIEIPSAENKSMISHIKPQDPGRSWGCREKIQVPRMNEPTLQRYIRKEEKSTYSGRQQECLNTPDRVITGKLRTTDHPINHESIR